MEFYPKLSDASIREEAVKMLQRRKEEKIARMLEKARIEAELASQKREEDDKTVSSPTVFPFSTLFLNQYCLLCFILPPVFPRFTCYPVQVMGVYSLRA